MIDTRLRQAVVLVATRQAGQPSSACTREPVMSRNGLNSPGPLAIPGAHARIRHTCLSILWEVHMEAHEQYSFFAFLSRMRQITRWGLMRNTVPENVQEHSH
jgi:hypothetical protein